MPEMRAYGTVPQAVNQDLQLPDRFPPLPDSIRKRFGSDATDFDAALGQFWTRTRRVLTDTYFDLAAPVNAVKADTRNIRKEYVTAIGTMSAAFNERIETIVSDAEAVAGRVTDIESAIDTPTTGILARIQEVELTRVTADEATALAVDAITASITGPGAGTIFAAVDFERLARVTREGWATGNIMLQATAGNVITGIYINSAVGPQGYTGPGAISSDVTIAAANFKIWNGLTKIQTFAVDGSGNVSVAGSITIGNAQVSGLGGLALANSVAWSTQVAGRPAELTDGRIPTAINSAGLVVTGVKPGIVVSPGGVAGLYLGSDKMGYYNGAAWRTYLDNAGNFFLGSGTSNSLSWTGGLLTLYGSVYATAGTIGDFGIIGGDLIGGSGADVIMIQTPPAKIQLGQSGSPSTAMTPGGFSMLSAAGATQVQIANGDLTISGIANIQGGMSLPSLGMAIGGDVNLYRSAANYLKTDDNFVVAQDLYVLGGVAFAGGGNRFKLVWNGSNVKIYVDGSVQGTIPNP